MLSELLKVYPKEKIIETLVPFLTEERIQTIDEVLANTSVSDEKGIIEKVFTKVKTKVHTEQILEAMG